MSPKSLMNKFAKSKTDFWKNEELQRVIGTGTLKVPVQSILNLLFPGQIIAQPVCIPVPHCRLWVQNSLPFANRCLLLQLAEVCVLPWLAGHSLPGGRIPQPPPQDVNLGP